MTKCCTAQSGFMVCHRASALYLTVVSLSVMLGATALTILATQRRDRALEDTVIVDTQAHWYARAGVGLALAHMDAVSGWRANVSNDVLLSDVPIGTGLVDVYVYDDQDNNVADDKTEPVRLVSVGSADGVERAIQVQLTALPHPALDYAVFGVDSNTISFPNDAEIRGPIRGHGAISGSLSVTKSENASFQTMTGYSISINLTPQSTTSVAISAPVVDLNDYLSRATLVSVPTGSKAEMKGYNLTPTNNPTGLPNADGIYVLNANAKEVRIEDCHIKGTLIIYNTGGNLVEIKKGFWAEPGPAATPVLLIQAGVGQIYFQPDSSFEEEDIDLIIQNGVGGTITVDEVDFNEDGDTSDTFVSRIQGLVWTDSAAVNMSNDNWSVAGCFIGRKVSVEDRITINDDPGLKNALNAGFVQSAMAIVPGSMQEVQLGS